MTSKAIYPHLLASVFNRPWAIHPDTMGVIVEVLTGRVAGLRLSEEEISIRLAAAAERQGPREGGKTDSKIAVLPMYGTISPKAGLLSNASGGASIESMRRDFRSAMADKDIDGIVFDIDSPGGSVEGVPEFADEIREARGTKPIMAVANNSAHSAAFWLASQADQFYVTKSGQVGSIGVISVHQDKSGFLAKEGIKPTFITSSQYKAEGNSAEPLSEEGIAYAQHMVDTYHSMFVEAVSQGRGVGVDAVESDFGKGRVRVAMDAAEAGMVDGIMSLEGVVQNAATVAQQGASVVSHGSLVGATPVLESFADRLARVLGEAEAVAAHAHERSAMRSEAGRSLSQDTRSRLEALRGTLETLVAEEPARSPDLSAKVRQLDMHIKLLGGKTT